MRLYFGVRRFKPRAKFATWLYSIALNLCRDHARSKQRKQSYATESLDVGDLHREVPSTDRSPDADAASREQLDTAEGNRGTSARSANRPVVIYRRRPFPGEVCRTSRDQFQGSGTSLSSEKNSRKQDASTRDKMSQFRPKALPMRGRVLVAV